METISVTALGVRNVFAMTEFLHYYNEVDRFFRGGWHRAMYAIDKGSANSRIEPGLLILCCSLGLFW